MTAREAVFRLEKMGYVFRLDEDGNIRFSAKGERSPEASALLEIARSDRDAAVAYVKEREAGAVVVDDGCAYSVLDALAIGQAVKDGQAVLLGTVVFHRDSLTVDVPWHPVRWAAEAVLQWHRERLETRLREAVREMEQRPLKGMTAAEVEQLLEKCSRYNALLNVEDIEDVQT